jgi:RNAse (barnase) inhibitor barstar
VLWMERNRRIFEAYEGVGVEVLWDRVRFWVALWASVSIVFKDYSFSSILSDWRAAAV